ncbi:MAG: hypothetical protein WC981_03585 [Candidatus Dojkabacteria bacterium]
MDKDINIEGVLQELPEIITNKPNKKQKSVSTTDTGKDDIVECCNCHIKFYKGSIVECPKCGFSLDKAKKVKVR